MARVRCGRATVPFVALGVVTLVGAFSFAGLGLLVASRAKTIEAVSGLMNLVMLPMWILSGTFFSYARFPDAMQPFVRALPLTALNDALRGVMIDGASLISRSRFRSASWSPWGAGELPGRGEDLPLALGHSGSAHPQQRQHLLQHAAGHQVERLPERRGVRIPFSGVAANRAPQHLFDLT